MKYTPKRKMRSYQAVGLKKLVALGSGMIWYDPGLGKTKTAYDLMNIFYYKHNIRKVIVLAPLSALGTWEREAIKDVLDDIDLNIKVIYEESNKKRVKEIQSFKQTISKDKLNIIVCNHDCVRNDEVWKELFSFGPNLMFIDEIHYFKSHKTQKFKRLQKIKRNSVLFAYGLTGTPIPKNPLDFFGQFLIINPRVLGSNYEQFRSRYAIMDYMFPSKVKKFLNMRELSQTVSAHAVRVKDTEAKNLPKLIIQDMFVPMTSKAVKFYDEMMDDCMAEVKSGVEIEAPMAATKVIKLHQICGGFLMKTFHDLNDKGDVVKRTECYPISDHKLKFLKDLVGQISGHQFIVGCRFSYEVRTIAEMLRQAGYRVAVIEGGVSGRKRATIEDDYQASKYDVIVFQLTAATAMTLTKGDVAILYSSTYQWKDYWQWLKRLHRDGQTRPVKVYRLICPGTIDESIMKHVSKNEDFTIKLVDSNSLHKILKGEG